MLSAAFRYYDGAALAVFAMLLFIGAFSVVIFEIYRKNNISELENLPLNDEVNNE